MALTARALESKNQETVHRLDKAGQAKTDYEEAEEKLDKAQSKIEEILARAHTVCFHNFVIPHDKQIWVDVMKEF